MTDEQWLWLSINMDIDSDIKLEGMCEKCKTSAYNGRDKCSSCGDPIDKVGFKNPNFDNEKYERLAEGGE